MARAGILYSQVASAASRLAAVGTNPTVDNVRAALGDTGSKGTIAPMLKQWKLQHVSETVSASAGIPADLLEAIKNVYERMEAGAQAQIDQMRAAQETNSRNWAQQLEAERLVGGQLRTERDMLGTELAQAKTALTHERDELQHGAVKIAALRAENDGLAQRLSDRAAEVRHLTDQLAQARHQFDHFQEKTAEQRQSERQGFEARIGTLEHDAQRLRTLISELQQHTAVLCAEKQGLQHRLEHANGDAKENLGQVYTLREQLAAANEMASKEHMEAAMTAELRDRTERENVRLHAINGGLLDHVSALKSQLDAAFSAIKARGAGKKN